MYGMSVRRLLLKMADMNDGLNEATSFKAEAQIT